MRIKKNTIITLAIVACVVFGMCYALVRRNPQNVFKREFNFILPQGSTIQGYVYTTGTIYAKIAIEPEYIDETIIQLERYFGDKNRATYYPNTGLSWWDIQARNVVKSYMKMESATFGFAVTSREKMAFISKDEGGGYYLYLLN